MSKATKKKQKECETCTKQRFWIYTNADKGSVQLLSVGADGTPIPVGPSLQSM